MAQKPLSDEQKRSALEAVRIYGSVSAAARALGMPRDTLQARVVRARSAAAAAASDAFTSDGDKAEITKQIRTRVRTLNDLVRACEIDLSEWDVERWTCNKWEMGSVPPVIGSDKKGWHRENNRPVVTELYQVKAWLKRKTPRERALDVLSKTLIEDIKRVAKTFSTPTPKMTGSGFLFEFTPFDLHMGKYAWNDETVTNYDADIAADLFVEARDFLLAQALRLAGGKLERVVMLVGNDVSHIDGKTGTTTGGTPMDVDTRYIRVFRRICTTHIEAVSTLLQAGPVDIVVVPGNHDEETSFHLGEVLAARFHNHKHVTVNNAPTLRKYYEFGVNLFGFAHGDALRVAELPLLMARERPAEWARCSSREWHIGHKHIAEAVGWKAVARKEARELAGEQDLHSDKGVRVRRLMSLSAHDAWHTRYGYTDRRACDSFVFHKKAGFTAHVSFNVDHFTGKAMR